MTKKKLTIGDIFKYQKQAMLIAKMQGEKSAEDFNTIIKILKNDLRMIAERGYGNQAPDAAQWKMWHLSPVNFCRLTPYYKAFGVSSIKELKATGMFKTLSNFDKATQPRVGAY